MIPEEAARNVWEGRIGDVLLRVDIQPSGRIAAQWRAKGGGDRRVVVNTIEELERSVLFQLMIAAPGNQQAISQEIAAAVAEGKQGLPDPSMIPRAPKKKRPRRPGPRPIRRRRR
jgi:hypothetical protein